MSFEKDISSTSSNTLFIGFINGGVIGAKPPLGIQARQSIGGKSLAKSSGSSHTKDLLQAKRTEASR